MTWTTLPRSEAFGLPAIVAGQGPRCILLHGVGLRAEAWNPLIDALSARFEVIAPDMPGHGKTPMRSGLNELRDYSDRIAPLLSERSIVIGHSMGAMIALDLAQRFAGQVAGVVALNAIFERSDAAKAAVQARAGSLDGQSMADPSGTLDRWFAATASDERAACHAWLTEVSPVGYKAAYSVFAQEDGPSRSALKQLDMPALFMTGADEPNSTPEMSQSMADLAPHGQAKVVPDAAHMLPMTHPETTAQALMSFAQAAFDRKGA